MVNGAFNRQHLNKRFRHFNDSLAREISRLTHGMTVSDFGAGIGLYTAHVRSWGLWAVGYDGTPGIAEQTGGLVQTANLAQWCELPITQAIFTIEVGEHIPPQFHEIFVDNLCKHATELIIVSWAVATPWQRGKNHVNNRNPSDLADDFRARSWFVDVQATAESRLRLDEPFRRKVLVLTRRHTSEESHQAAKRFLQDSLTAKQIEDYLRRILDDCRSDQVKPG